MRFLGKVFNMFSMSYPLFINIAKVWVHKHFMLPLNILFLPPCLMPNTWYITNPTLLKARPISQVKFMQ